MPKMQGVPEGYAPVVVGGRIRLVPKEGHTAQIIATDAGYWTGRTGSVLVTPFEALGSLARDFAGSAFGQGVYWGWTDGQRGKQVRAVEKTLKNEDEIQQRTRVAAMGLMDGPTAASAKIEDIRALLAQASVKHPMFDENSVRAPAPVVVDPAKAKPANPVSDALKAAGAAVTQAVTGSDAPAPASAQA